MGSVIPLSFLRKERELGDSIDLREIPFFTGIGMKQNLNL
jgi:hypothetical protein